MTSRGNLSPVVLAVLALLAEGPRHAYGMQQLIKERGVDLVVNVRTRSGLHTALDRLVRDGLVRVHAVERAERRPERTLYAITETGREALLAAVRSGISAPAAEFPLFPAAVSFLHLLTPEDTLVHLRQRIEALRQQLDTTEAVLQASHKAYVPRLHLLEHEHRTAVVTAELAWLHGVCEDLETGELGWEPYC
ncbi:PadR family transcriptional regulator [Amycolatopsis rubida]|uniref:DNA-binding transcriptional regulator, PadR family n=1 Tax=Amycolatopsis rubida TaxID=112413 RepID=A0A1I6B5S0_9PSEU|nr:helix-turn-helix transcriptional regulator [Amycolatopsis rubida]SFQ76259.1 DNA-binding transcriptional regulator, PadR family [Amycolatopsis rubida]